MTSLFSGIAEGLSSGQAIKANRQNAAIQQQELGLRAQESAQKQKIMQMEIDDKERANSIRDGLNEAFSSGGFEASMDYLQHTDMKTYLEVKKGKAEVDESIARAATSQYATAKEKAEAIQAGHAIIGRFGATLMKIPENERPQAYQQLAPILKQVYPGMPEEYDEKAQTLMMVSMGVSMPDSILYGAQKTQARAQTAIGKIQADILKLKESGLSDDDEGIKALNNQLKSEIENSTSAQLDAAKNAPNEDVLRKQYVDLNKNFIAVTNQWNQVKNYNNGNATPMGDMKLIYAFNKMMNPNDAVKEGEYANTTNAAGWSDRARNEYNKAIKGNLISPRLRDDMLKQGASLYSSFNESYQGVRSQYTEIAVRRGLDPKNVVIDLDTQNSGMSSTPPSDWAQKVKSMYPDFSDADIAAAWQHTQQQKASQQQQSPQQAAPQAGAQQQPVGEGNPPWQAR